jgi:RNA polymerase sigma-70 factor (ECF subfamily)
VLAATIRVTGEIDLAEECVQEAFARALAVWPSSGIPKNSGAWLTVVARRRAIDQLRRQSTQRRLLAQVGSSEETEPVVEVHSIPDDRLRLIFTCCHPALSLEAQVALTLRLLCGLTTSEVARAFLVSETAMAARITRAKRKIAAAHIPYRIPTEQDLPERIDAVLSVLHLVFSTGHTAPSGVDLVRLDLVERAIDLARLMWALVPTDPEVGSLLALILLTDARRETRTGPRGSLRLLSEQDRGLWDHAAINEGLALVDQSWRSESPGRFALMARIAAVHARAPTWAQTDWAEIIRHYDRLVEVWPSPVVALNRAVAVGFAAGPAAGLDEVERLRDDPQLAGYSYLASARADFLRQLGRLDEARADYETALRHCDNDVERIFLQTRLDGLSPR